MRPKRQDGVRTLRIAVATFTPPTPENVVRAGTLWGCLAVMDG